MRVFETTILFAVSLLLIAFNAVAQPADTNSTSVHFRAVDVFVDSANKSFAAYQLEFAVTNGAAKIVGIEGGEQAAFREAPFYDPQAMQQERVVIAAFSMEKKLPSGRTRVATIHLQLSPNAEPQIELKSHVIADAKGKEISAKTSFEMRAKQ